MAGGEDQGEAAGGHHCQIRKPYRGGESACITLNYKLQVTLTGVRRDKKAAGGGDWPQLGLAGGDHVRADLG